MTKMQQVRYYVAFRVDQGLRVDLRRRHVRLGLLLGVPPLGPARASSTGGRTSGSWAARPRTATTARSRTTILRNHRVTYQSPARSHTIAPRRRCARSWSSSCAGRRAGCASRSTSCGSSGASTRSPPRMTYVGVLFPWVAPIVVFHVALLAQPGSRRPVVLPHGRLRDGAPLLALLRGLARRSPLWYHGITFIVIYMAFLVWQTYYALLTLRNTNWGTRASTPQCGRRRRSPSSGPARRRSPRGGVTFALPRRRLVPRSNGSVAAGFARASSGCSPWLSRRPDHLLHGAHLRRLPDVPEGPLQPVGAVDPAATTRSDAGCAAPISRIPITACRCCVYHGIGRNTTDTADAKYVVSRTNFAEQMRALHAAGYHAITSSQLAEYLRTGNPSLLPARPMLITFDDGRDGRDAPGRSDPQGHRHDGDHVRDRQRPGSLGASTTPPGARSPTTPPTAAGSWRTTPTSCTTSRMSTAAPPPTWCGWSPVRRFPTTSSGSAMTWTTAESLIDQNGPATRSRLPTRTATGVSAAAPGVAAALHQVLRQRFRLAFDQDQQSGWRPALPGDDPCTCIACRRWTGPARS